MNLLKKLFAKPSAQTLAVQELEDSQRQLLSYQTQAEYTAQMCKFYQEKIKRLSGYVQREQT